MTVATEPDYKVDKRPTRPTLDKSCIGTRVRISACGGTVRLIDVGSVGEIVKVNAKTFAIRLTHDVSQTSLEVIRATPGHCIVIGDPPKGALLSRLPFGEVVEV